MYVIMSEMYVSMQIDAMYVVHAMNLLAKHVMNINHEHLSYCMCISIICLTEVGSLGFSKCSAPKSTVTAMPVRTPENQHSESQCLRQQTCRFGEPLPPLLFMDVVGNVLSPTHIFCVASPVLSDLWRWYYLYY